MKRDLPTGIFHTRRGYRAYQWIPAPGYPNGRIASKRFPPDASVAEMQRWREAQRVLARQKQSLRDANLPPTGHGFMADADRYLETVRAMRSWKERRREILAWALAFGEQETDTITATQIRAMRDQWLTVGPKRVQERQPDGRIGWVEKPLPLAPQSVNLRLRALENFFTVMFPSRPNPVRDVDEAVPPDPAPRGETFQLALEILSCMPDVTTPQKGGVAEPGSKSRARFEVMLFTGLSASQVGRLRPEHVDWTLPAFIAPRRQKGRLGPHRQRGRVRTIAPRPLLPEAVAALRRLFALSANTPFHSSSITRSVKAAIRAANAIRAQQQRDPIPLTLRIYDLTRHTFGTELFRATRNLAHVQYMLGHSDPAMSQRYAMAAVREDLLVGMSELAKRVHALTTGKVSPPPRPSRRRAADRAPQKFGSVRSEKGLVARTRE